MGRRRVSAPQREPGGMLRLRELVKVEDVKRVGHIQLGRSVRGEPKHRIVRLGLDHVHRVLWLLQVGANRDAALRAVSAAQGRKQGALPLKESQEAHRHRARDAAQASGRAIAVLADHPLAVKHIGVGAAAQEEVDELLRAVPVRQDQWRREVGVACHHRQPPCEEHRVEQQGHAAAGRAGVRTCRRLNRASHLLLRPAGGLHEVVSRLPHRRQLGRATAHHSCKPAHPR
mmetsp:Transcript_6743/g.19573  ORF Transcript_6743/g.19573 Transcript_6743/m.19573 type:complete len:230 (+) Transcript_6743:433-1122(+)